MTTTTVARLDTSSELDATYELSVVMPCLNEASTVGLCIRKAQHALADMGVAGEVVVADNGSSDGSPEIVEQLGARLVRVEARGYGNAILAGIAAARGEFIIIGDADDSYDFTNLRPFLERLRQGYDLVMGNRFQGGIQPGAMRPLHRYLGNPVLTGIGRLFFNSPCGDFHCGLRAITATAAKQLDLRMTGMEFASEMVIKATLRKMRIAEVPTVLYPDGRNRPSHLRSWRDGWRHLRFMLLYSPRWLFLYPGALLMGLGLLLGAWLISGPRAVGGVTLDVHTLLYAAAAVLLGFQALAFGMFTKIFTITEGLMPDDPSLASISRFLTLEGGILVGSALIATGLIGSVLAVLSWGEQSFGPLNTAVTLRTIIPSFTALILGSEVILYSFFMSVLGLGRR